MWRRRACLMTQRWCHGRLSARSAVGSRSGVLEHHAHPAAHEHLPHVTLPFPCAPSSLRLPPGKPRRFTSSPFLARLSLSSQLRTRVSTTRASAGCGVRLPCVARSKEVQNHKSSESLELTSPGNEGIAKTREIELQTVPGSGTGPLATSRGATSVLRVAFQRLRDPMAIAIVVLLTAGRASFSVRYNFPENR